VPYYTFLFCTDTLDECFITLVCCAHRQCATIVIYDMAITQSCILTRCTWLSRAF